MKMVFLALGLWAGTQTLAQQAPNLGDLGSMVKPAEAPESTLPESFPLAQVAEQAQATEVELQVLQSDADTDRILQTVTEQLPKMTKEAAARTVETTALLMASPSLETLQTQEASWRQVRKVIAGWTADLTGRADSLEKRTLRLTQYEGSWSKTLEEAQKAGAMPEILQRIKGVIAAIKKTRTANDKVSADLVVLQTKVDAEDSRARENLSSVEQAQTRAIRMLMKPDAPVLWSPKSLQQAGEGVKKDSTDSLKVQWASVGAYLERQRGSLVVHGIIIAALFSLLNWMRRHVGQWVAADESLSSATVVFKMPISAALMLSVLFSSWIYLEPPRLFWAILGGLALVPTFFVLHRLVAGALRVLLYALVAFYLFGLVLSVSASLPVVSRFLLLAETSAGVAFCIWFLRSSRE
ncbi:MAG TPA: hypothetical protein VK956_07245, partial [Verrucomicrobium sp.]|nr:hypothetical protein [Verrucomicrobium sp.]